MRTADLYVRVSTDEQAEKGYSQRNQDEVLRKFCEINRIQNDKLDRARDLLLANDLEPSDYKEIKVKCEKQVNILEAKLAEVSFNRTSSTSTDRIIYKVIGVLSKLPLTYKEGSISKRRDIIGSIFPEKLVFDGTQHRTGRINEVARLIYLVNSKLDQNKNRKVDCLKSLSCAVLGAGIEPALALGRTGF